MTQKTAAGSMDRRPFYARLPAILYMLVCVLLALFPLVWVILSSFKTNQQILSSAISLPTAFSFDGYRMALKVSPILRFFFNSVVITLISTGLNVFLVSMAAYAFARTRFPGKNLLFTLLALSMVIPVTALMQPVYQVISGLGLLDSLPGLILVYMALNMPLTLLIMRATFAGVPASLEEAAYIDGAGFMRTYLKVMLPVAKGGWQAPLLNAWNEFTFALVLTKSAHVRTLPLSLSYFTSQFTFNYTALFAAITMAVLPSILVFAAFQEQVSQSLVIGAVKG